MPLRSIVHFLLYQHHFQDTISWSEIGKPLMHNPALILDLLLKLLDSWIHKRHPPLESSILTDILSLPLEQFIKGLPQQIPSYYTLNGESFWNELKRILDSTALDRAPPQKFPQIATKLNETVCSSMTVFLHGKSSNTIECAFYSEPVVFLFSPLNVCGFSFPFIILSTSE